MYDRPEHESALAADLGRRARDAGIAAAEARPGADWDRAVIDQAIEHHAQLGAPFSANTIRPWLPEVAGPLIGAAFVRASRRGLIVKLGTTASTDPGTHAHHVGLWCGTRSTRSVSAEQPRTRPGGTGNVPNASTGLTAPRSASSRSRTGKATDLLTAGRVHVIRADEDGRTVVQVDGDHGTYTARRTAGGRWSCNCPAGRYGSECSHLAAAQLITIPAGATS
jgi:hypothetical protein